MRRRRRWWEDQKEVSHPSRPTIGHHGAIITTVLDPVPEYSSHRVCRMDLDLDLALAFNKQASSALA